MVGWCKSCLACEADVKLDIGGNEAIPASVEADKKGLAAALKAGDTVLVKGSNGSKMAVIIDALKARGA